MRIMATVRSLALLALLPLVAAVTGCRAGAPEYDNQAVDAMYAQSHALFEHLFRHHRRALGEYLMAVQSTSSGAGRRSSSENLFASHFGNLAGLDRRLLAQVESD